MNHYNGYTPAERSRKLRASYKVFPNRSHPCYHKPCAICSDTATPVEPHTEDYSEPYRWEPPAEYPVCKTCHGRLHKRFNDPSGWAAYKLHLKRGGHGSDLKTPRMRDDVKRIALALARGESPALPTLRPPMATDLWWDSLTIDPASLTAVSARPRP